MRIATFNLESLDLAPKASVPLDVRAKILRPALKRLNADVLCLQEVNKAAAICTRSNFFWPAPLTRKMRGLRLRGARATASPMSHQRGYPRGPMSYKTILMQCNDKRRISPLLAIAVNLADRFQAHLLGLSVAPPCALCARSMPEPQEQAQTTLDNCWFFERTWRVYPSVRL